MPVRTLRLRIGLLRFRRRLALGRLAFLRSRGLELAQAALQVVEDEPDRRLRRRRRRDQTIAVPNDEDTSGLQRDLELSELAAIRPVALLLGLRQQRLGLLCHPFRALVVGQRGADDFTAAFEDNRSADLRRDLAETVEGGGGVHALTLTRRRRYSRGRVSPAGEVLSGPRAPPRGH